MIEVDSDAIILFSSLSPMNDGGAGAAEDVTMAAAASTLNSTMISAAAATTAIEVPQWMIDMHHFRKRTFLRVVEPIIVFILGPAKNDTTSPIGGYSSIMHHADPSHRRLGFLPSYVEDVNYLRASSMSFATLTMMLIIMAVILLVFLSCFYHNQKTSPLFVSPRRHRLPKLVPPPLPVDGAFSWVKVCLFMSDEEVSCSSIIN